MSEPRTLVVTVGKSLFSSATWRCEDYFDFRGYRRWFERGQSGRQAFLQNPELRAQDSATLDKVRSVIERQTPEDLARLVSFESSDDPRRFCAELTTLLVMYRETEHPSKSLEDFLGDYRSVDLICPTDSTDEANIAARHLDQILRNHGAKSSASAGSLLKTILRSDTSRQRIQQWGEYLGDLNASNVDLVVTGGYKGFALFAGDAWARVGSERGWRVIYLHQDNKTDLFVHEQDKIVARAPGEEPVTLYRPASRTL